MHTHSYTHKKIYMFTHSQDVVVSCSKGLPRSHNTAFGVNKELSVLIAVHYAVGEFTVRSFITIISKHSIDGLSLFSSFSLWKFDLVDLLRKDWLVVIFIQDLNHHPYCTVPWTITTIGHHHL